MQKCTLVRFEIWYALFLFAGVAKTTPWLAWMPVDLTVVALVASVLSAAFAMNNRGWKASRDAIAAIAALLVFVAYLVASLLWSMGREYAIHKAIHVATFCSWSYMVPSLVVSGSPDSLRRLAYAVIAIASVVAIQVIIVAANDPLLVATEWGRSYLGYGRLFGFALVLVFSYLLWSRLRARNMIFAALLGILLAAGLMVGGGRGPLMAVVVALIAMAFSDFNLRERKLQVGRRSTILFTVVVIAAGLSAFAGETGVFLRTIQRIAMLFTDGDPNSFGKRLWYIEQAPRFWSEAPIFGSGVGSWPILCGWGDYRAYPHNIVLELAIETGIVGIVLFGVLVAFAVRGLRHYWILQKPVAWIGATVLAVAGMNAFVSGDLVDNRALFAALGLAAGMQSPETVEAQMSAVGAPNARALSPGGS